MYLCLKVSGLELGQRLVTICGLACRVLQRSIAGPFRAPAEAPRFVAPQVQCGDCLHALLNVKIIGDYGIFPAIAPAKPPGSVIHPNLPWPVRCDGSRKKAQRSYCKAQQKLTLSCGFGEPSPAPNCLCASCRVFVCDASEGQVLYESLLETNPLRNSIERQIRCEAPLTGR